MQNNSMASMKMFLTFAVCFAFSLQPSKAYAEQFVFNEILGKEAYLTIGVFAWSLNGDYEIDRPFLCFRKTKGQKSGFTFKLA